MPEYQYGEGGGAFTERFTAQRAMIDRVMASHHVYSTKLICIRAILDGDYGPLPRGAALITLAGRAGVSRRTAFRAGTDTAGATLAGLFGEAESRMDDALLPSRMRDGRP